MSRLEKHKQKQYTITVTSIIIVLIILLVFIFTVGFKLLLNTSAFIASIGSTKTSTQPLEKNDDFIGNISIDSIPSATNGATIIVSGNVLNFNKVEFFINGERVKETSLPNSDSFEVEVGDLQKGSNEFYAVGKTSGSKSTKKTQVFTVLYDNEKPKLEVGEPANDSKTNKQEIKIAGTTEKEVFVRINDLPVVVDVQGNFQTSVNLKEGSNTYTITAEDIAGNVETKTVTVTYQKDD